MAFRIQVKKSNGEVVWTRQWATEPSDDNIDDATINDGISKGGLFRHAQEVSRAIKQIRDDRTISSVSHQGGLEVHRA